MEQTLQLLTDDSTIDEFNYWPIIIEAVEAGIDVLQLRFKKRNKKTFYEIAKSIRSYLNKNKVKFIINDHVDIALAVEADGVHLGQTDLPVLASRRLLGPKKLIGLSLSSYEEYTNSQHQAVDYYGVGPVFLSPTKEKKPMGLNQLAAICQVSSIPCIAIGGITDKNANETLKVGAMGLAVSHFITASDSPYDATKKLKHLL